MTVKSFKLLAVLCSLLFYFIPILNTLQTIAPGQSLKANETLSSAAGTFEAGFFSFGNSNAQYFGIWYKNVSPKTIVWVVNRDTPIGNSSGLVLQLTDGGNPVILDGKGSTIWSFNASSATAENPILQLLDSGNLVVKEENSPQNLFLWQSFDYPGDTLLAGMRIRSNRITGQHTSMTSWRNTEDPSEGVFSYYIDTHGLPQVVIAKEGALLYRVGSWNGYILSGISSETLFRDFNITFVMTKDEVSYGYDILNSSIISRYMITPGGLVQRFIWSDQTQSWQLFYTGPVDQCDNYALCGQNANCNVNNSPVCECLKGFSPKNKEKWDSLDWSDGCARVVNLNCDNRDGFLKYTGMKIPNTSSSWYEENMNLEDCEKLCLKNCSCTAYANLDIRDGGNGCLLWFNNIVDMRKLPSGGQEFYIRVAASELDQNNKRLNKQLLAGILVGFIFFIIVITILGVAITRRAKLKKTAKNKTTLWRSQSENQEKEDIDIPIFDLSTMANATSNFSISNKLGEGGFGPVYKGTLSNGEDIAVKRLRKNSGLGLEQFFNEAMLIANLQHRNLVKLLGCCIEDDERLLIYEFMPNRSLDYFVFDKTRRSLLSWTRRFHIIGGIARGLLYLHEDSRLRIIHRDLKTSNVLLDKNMNPRISDFGLARIFGGDEVEGKTTRVMGTYGYISPEYAVRGCFSVKSDVFSFGVVVLEIVSGKKNTDFFDKHDVDLLSHAWRLWSEESSLELIDESLGNSMSIPEVLRCIHTGLLCVQERAEDRPDMSAVVLMLNGEKPLPRPREPAFYPRKSEFGSSSGNCEQLSTNEISVTLLHAR